MKFIFVLAIIATVFAVNANINDVLTELSFTLNEDPYTNKGTEVTIDSIQRCFSINSHDLRCMAKISYTKGKETHSDQSLLVIVSICLYV
jgi:hypothetical protein